MGQSARALLQYATTPLYNTRLVVSATGVPADTFRAWERRYGIPAPQRGAGGQRLYSERDIATIRWLRERTSEGLTISQAIALLRSETERSGASDQPRSHEQLVDELLQALLRFDAPEADDVLSEAFAIYSVEKVCTEIIQPTLVQIGELWHRGAASVAQEHFASQFLRRKLLALLNIYDVIDGRATILAACAPGEYHDLGLLLLALMLVRRNYRVVFLGADVPAEALLEAAAQIQPAVICLSASTAHTFEHAIAVAQQVQAANPELIVCIGGQGLSATSTIDQRIHLFSNQALAAVDQIGALLAQRRGA